MEIKSSHRLLTSNQVQLSTERDVRTQKSDESRLQLQNLQYEAYHLRKKITQCKQFTSRHTQIDLIPTEQYLSRVNETAANNLNEQSTEHEITLGRLQDELSTRQSLLKSMNDLNAQKALVIQQNQEKQTRIKEIRENLKSYGELNKKLSDFFQPGTSNINEQQDVARSLPTPLYILYNVLATHQLHFDSSLRVNINGDAKEGQKLLNEIISGNFQASIQQEDEQEEPMQEDLPQEELEDATNLNDDDMEQKRTGVKATRKPIQASTKDTLFKPFPLSVSVSVPVNIKNSQPTTITLDFYYLPHLNMITVNQSSTTNTLNVFTLIPGDDGVISPNVQYTNYDFSTLEVGRPYQWAQPLAGLFPMTPPSLSKNTHSMSISTIIKLIKYKTQASAHLAPQIRDLEKLKINADKSMFDKKIEMSDFKLQSEDSDGVKLYLAIFSGDANKIKIHVTLKISSFDYPLQPPQFKISIADGQLSSANQHYEIPNLLKKFVKGDRVISNRDATAFVDSQLLDIETDLNEKYVNELMQVDKYSEKQGADNDAHFNLLSKLMSHLWSCLNVYASVNLGTNTRRLCTRDY
ncbi:THO complex subunit THOC5 [Acrasis kona]|uniref:THO complex subunit THOC5 n=1 Tax=Acrasis kona TaxID=1008807 RepID=A0AAW2Z782_9EUKA